MLKYEYISSKKLDKPYYMMYNIKARVCEPKIVNCGDIREGTSMRKTKPINIVMHFPNDKMAFDKKYISAVCDAVYEISKSSNTRTHYVNFELLLEAMWEFSEKFCTKASEKAF